MIKKIVKSLPVAFIYVQGIALANPIYLIFTSLFFGNLRKLRFNPWQLVIFIALMISQLIGFISNPHLLPLSAVGSIVGLFAFSIKSETIFSWDHTERERLTFKYIFIWTLLIYLLDSFLRIGYLSHNITGWTDYDLKTLVKTSSYLCDDTNTLAIRIIFLYFIARSLDLVKERPFVSRIIFLYLILTCFSRAALIGLLLIFYLEIPFIKRRMQQVSVPVLSVTLGILIVGAIFLLPGTANFDSSIISKFDLVTGSIQHWTSFNWLNKLFGLGYYSNVDVGITNPISGHSVVYYLMVDFGLLGAIFLGLLLYRGADTREGRYFLIIYLFLGLSIFRFDFLFLYVTLFFVDKVTRRVN